MKSLVTILIYTFPPPGNEAGAFSRIVASVERTWKLIGELSTVIVSCHRFNELESFAANHSNVTVQIEPTLVPGQIRTMSIDCIKNLHKRFSTPYVLIIQDDGYPLKSNLADFVGKADYWGAPIISDGWKRKLAYAIGFGSFNGGFSLRSRAFCEHASRKWFSIFSKFVKEDKLPVGEDVYYTFWLKFLPSTWLKFKFPNERDAFRFSVDRLSGHVTPPADADPFGVHGKMPGVTVLAYHFCDHDNYERSFESIKHAFRETWRHCGKLKSVLVVNRIERCVEAFASENDHLEIQVETSLVPGNIFTMSADMNGKLHTRFSTPYVLVIQSDGYPLRSGLLDFVGKYDFIGAPYVGLQWWKQLIARMFNCHVQNGGFSLRSHKICDAAAKLWNMKYSAMGDCRSASEDIFYTETLVRREGSYRRQFRFATGRESLRFSWDALVPIPRPIEKPFGFHRHCTLTQLVIKE